MEFQQINQQIEELLLKCSNLKLSAVEKHLLLNKAALLFEQLQQLQPAATAHFAEPVQEKTSATNTEPAQIEEVLLEALAEEPVALINEEPVAEITPNEPSEIEIQIEIRKTEQSLMGKFEKEDNSLLNEKFSAQSKGLNERAAQGDLKRLIDFNRQFIFTQELFGNDSNAFVEAVNKLNAISDIRDAFTFINSELVPKYNWNMSSDNVKLFDKIVRQKFGL